MKWFVYIVECSDKNKSLYTGISPNVEERVKIHNAGKGAKSVRGKLPVQLVYTEEHNSQIEAAARERQIKSWHRKYKLNVIKSGVNPKKIQTEK